MFHHLTNKRGAILIGLAALLSVLTLQVAGFAGTDRLGLLLFDRYQRAAPRAFEDAGVRIVDIDDESIRRLGQWPWPRTDVAALVRKLTAAGASTVAFDVVFAEPDRTSPALLAKRVGLEGGAAPIVAALAAMPDHDTAFAQTLQEAPSVLGYFLTREGSAAAMPPKAGMAVVGSPPSAGVPRFPNAIQPLAPLRDAASGGGFVSLIGDADGIIRKAPLIAFQGDQLMPALSLDALRTAQGAGSITVKSSDASGEYGGEGEVVSLKTGRFEVPTTHAGELWMYYTAPHPERVVPAWKILTGQLSASEMEREFSGRIVLIGTGAAGLRDLVATPVQDRELGVMVHAQAIEQMVLGKFLVRPDWAVGLERSLLLALGLILVLALPLIGAVRGAVLGAVLVGGVGYGSWYAFRADGFLLDPTYIVLGLSAVYAVETVWTYYREERQRAYIHRAFDRYLSPDMVKRIVDDPGQLELGGEEREMTVLFCDIRGFSRLSEQLDPQTIIRFLIAFLTPMCDVLLNRKATIDKFIGDAIVAFWNAPLDDPEQYANAARGSLAMVERLAALNRDCPPDWPGNVQIGIGLNAGPCCVGNMGSAQRLSYSLIGDTVNLASRIEGLTKLFGVQIAIGSALAAHLPDFAVLPLGRVRVVGRAASETVFVLLGDEALAQDAAYRAFAAGHGVLFDAYHARDWAGAAALIEAGSDPAAGYGLAKLYDLMRDRIAGFAVDPPGADWEGVFEATEK
ncbi:CHASE2 domain-containing protein [Sphingomonas sp. HMP6]|uniref:CHASE2 domain-containing protein n=1 Tax=Sphingomonas sp. HMP6 TaxID=1517551 RepID=UPI001596767E|nr:adenylate/guanylate cyclase domain-containing protein [Sphingomonas sp. HMP6]BCA59540.1 hypothetical protein HMP06_2309 [Sphingomonas sp. HMP6]